MAGIFKQRWLIALLALACCESANAQQVHVLMVSCTADATLARGCQVTLQNVQETFQRLVPANRYTFTVRESARHRITADSVLDDIRRISVGANDTLLFMFHGHGGRSGGRHFLDMSGGGRLFSRDLQAAVNRKSCKLRIILTDSCNRFVDWGFFAFDMEECEWDARTQGIAPVMQELLFNHRGLLHMNAAWPGQYSFTYPGIGSVFFFQLFTVYCEGVPTGRPTWRSIDRRLSRIQREVYQGPDFDRWRHEQTTWYPIAWSYPTYLWYDSPRFGVVASEKHTTKGVTITKVTAGTPAKNLTVTRAGQHSNIRELSNNDVILTINDNEVDSERAHIEFVSCSPRTMEFTFRRDGTTYAARVRLACSATSSIKLQSAAYV